jgi:hypothetical protein
MSDIVLGFAAGAAVAVAAYEILVLRGVRREIEECTQSLRRARLFVAQSPVKSNLSDSSPSLPL